MVCEKCGKVYTEDYRKDARSRKTIPSRFCSRSCANSKERSPALRKKISKAMKNSEKAKAVWRSQVGVKRPQLPREFRICPSCSCEFEVIATTARKYCCEGCRRVAAGGYREGSVKNHVHGKYKGYYYDSSWELIWIKYALSQNIVFERNTKGFPYEYQGVPHLYYPDFYLPEEDRYVEVKGLQDELWEAKKRFFPHTLETVGAQEITQLANE